MRGYHEERKRVIEGFERAWLITTLMRVGGNVSAAARQGGVDRTHIYRLAEKHEIDLDRFRDE